MSTILVTGGAGFIGAYVCRRLAAAGHRLIAYDAVPDGNVLDMLPWPEGTERPLKRLANPADPQQLEVLIAQEAPDAIVHLASPLVEDVEKDPCGGLRQIVDMTCGIFDTALRQGVPRVVWASSLAVFGRHNGDPLEGMGNSQPHRPTSLYGAAKSLCEMASQRFRNQGLDAIGLRFTFVYGAGRLRGRASYPSHLLRAAASGERVTVPFSDQVLNWQYVEDLAELVALLVAHPGTSKAPVYNVNGDPRTLREAGLAIEADAQGAVAGNDPGFDPNYKTTPMALDDSMLRSEFGWRPAHGLEAGVAATMALYREMAHSASHNITTQQ